MCKKATLQHARIDCIILIIIPLTPPPIGKYSKLFFSIIACQTAGLIGIVPTLKSIPTWYAGLNKPSFNPPNEVFGPVWTILYFMMAISLYLVWSKEPKNEEERKEIKQALILFWVHLFFNVAWTFIFFGFHQTGLAFLDSVILWLLIGFLFAKFWKLNKTAAYLLIPYWMWTTYVIALSFALWQLNY